MQPIWYQTRRFYALCGLLAILAVWSVWQLRIRQIRNQFSVVLAERARVGREIHDTLLQSLVGMALQLDNVSTQLDSASQPVKDELARMRHQVEHYIGEAQQSIWELRSPRLDAVDLGAMLCASAERITGSAGVRFEFVTSGTPRPVPPQVERQVLRIAQEAVVNAVRHAEPSEVRMELAYERDAVHVRVTDDGHGFDPDTSRQGHWGLSIMRERAEQIGGSFAVSSSRERGTRVDLVAPIAGHA